MFSGNINRRQPNSENAFEEFEAAQLYCPVCKQAVPVRKQLLLSLPGGDKYDYKCRYCNAIVGAKTDSAPKPLF